MNAPARIAPVDRLHARIAAIQAEFDPGRPRRRQPGVWRRWYRARMAGALALRMAGYDPVWIGALLEIPPCEVKRVVHVAARLTRTDDAFNDLLDAVRAEIGNAPPQAPVPVDAAVRDWRDVVAAILGQYNLSWADLTGPCRVRFLAEVRHLAMAVLVARGNSRSQVGRWLKRDHSSVISGLDAFAWRAARPEYAAMLALFRCLAPEGVEPGDLVRERAA